MNVASNAWDGATGPAAADVSFDAFYRAHYGPLVRLACGVVSPSVAEDMVQESFLVMRGDWNRVATLERPDLWARRVVVNRCRSLRRRLGAEARALTGLRLTRPAEVLIVEEDEALWSAVRSLPGRQAQAVMLVYVDGCSHREVAEILGCSESTVGVHLHRARRALESRPELGVDHEDR